MPSLPINAQYRKSPIILLDLHSATTIPSSFPLEILKNVRLDSQNAMDTIVRKAPDAVVPAMTGIIEQEEHSYVQFTVPRAIVDVVRPMSRVDHRTVQGGIVWQDRPPESYPNGLYWAGTIEDVNHPERIEPLLRAPWTQKQQAALLEYSRIPLARTINDIIDKTVAEFGYAIVLDMHHMPNDVALVGEGPWKGAYAQGQTITKVGPFDPKNGTLPNLAMIANAKGGMPTSCHPIVTNVIQDVFAQYGFEYIVLGEGPLQGDFGPPVEYGSPQDSIRPVHVVSLEAIFPKEEDNVHPGRVRGDLKDMNLEAIARIKQAYESLYTNLQNLSPAQLKK